MQLNSHIFKGFFFLQGRSIFVGFYILLSSNIPRICFESLGLSSIIGGAGLGFALGCLFLVIPLNWNDLQSLTLNGNFLGFEGMKVLAAGLQACSGLTCLELRHTLGSPRCSFQLTK
jgi:hypothetical protein